MIAVAAALLLLAESFGRDVIWLYRTGASPRTRRAVRIAVTVLAVAGRVDRSLGARPCLAVHPRPPLPASRWKRWSWLLSRWCCRPGHDGSWPLSPESSFGLLTIDKILNMAFYEEVDRAFNPVNDWVSISQAMGVVRDAIGTTLTNIALAAVGIGLILLVAAITASTIHITTVAARHRRGTVRGLAALTAIWGLCAGLSLQLVPGSPVASASATGLAVSQVRATQAALSDPRRFEQAIHSPDPEASVPASDLLTGLRGKDVIIAFVESYGQVAVQGTSFSPGVDAVLRQRTASLARVSWSTQSAWLTSPTFGGISWLAHSTLQSGLWVNSTQRYAELVASSRFTLSDAFDKAGWHTVADDPADDHDLAARHVTSTTTTSSTTGTTSATAARPSATPSMPDQYTLAAFQRLELAPGHKPVMAEIDLTSSHMPWAPLPTMVPWNKVGNGSIFDPQPAQERIRVHGLAQRQAPCASSTAKSIQYSMMALTSWVTELNDPNLVLILLGDHQPAHRHQRPRGQPRRADLDRRPRPFGVQADCLLALAGRAAARSSALRSSPWTPSAISSSTPSARPPPRRHRPGPQVAGVRPATRSLPADRGPALTTGQRRAR